MEFLSAMGGTASGFFGSVIPFLIVLTIVVFVHEMGHFLVGRWCGVGVHAFSIGFGPELVGFNDKHGTRWKLCAIPLGGYVKFHGDANGASIPDAQSVARMRNPGPPAETFVARSGPKRMTGRRPSWSDAPLPAGHVRRTSRRTTVALSDGNASIRTGPM